MLCDTSLAYPAIVAMRSRDPGLEHPDPLGLYGQASRGISTR